MFDKYKIKLTLINPILGTNPIDTEVMDTHIIEKQRKLILEKSKINKELNAKYLNAEDISDESKKLELEKIGERAEELLETIDEHESKGTCFFFHNGMPAIGNHMIYGFMKAASGAICRTHEKARETILQSKAYTCSVINEHVRIDSKFLVFDKDIKRKENGKPDYFQRSLRATTPQGPRVTLAKSEVVEEGASIEFILKVFEGSPLKESHIKRIFDYGELKGLGQWRNADFGSFTYTLEKL